ncbi:hypothetical protein [Bradyrhizobium australiense]|uniref:Uncharacterized protein n=1 Tax=Bradyrhizobium australiense TaxID=2721161 RepID=A0A7Y4GNW3_9BRAD|nr:hypothetical protein [Bradyrhizobium australiense]NOJ39131.1 hypothetical protein [Bradyrhizobium australiense]
MTKIAAFLSVGFIIYDTLVPLGMRPTISEIGADCERFAAYAMAAGFMVVACPRHSIRLV